MTDLQEDDAALLAARGVALEWGNPGKVLRASVHAKALARAANADPSGANCLTCRRLLLEPAESQQPKAPL